MTRFTDTRCSIFTVCLLMATIVIFADRALAQSPIKVRLTFSKAVYNLDNPAEKIDAVITLQNISGSPIYTQENFSEVGYQLYLYFLGPEPDSTLITASYASTTGSPTPSVPPLKIVSELLPADWLINMNVEEIRDYYPLTLPGKYKAWFKLAFVQYDDNQAVAFDKDGDGVIDGYHVPYDAVIGFEPLATSAPVYITLRTQIAAVGSDIRVKATEFIYNKAYKKGVTKEPLMGLDVKIYKISDIMDRGISKVNQKAYEDIVKNPLIPVFRTAEQTATPGEYFCVKVPKDDYVVIGYADWVTDYKHLGSIIESDDENWDDGEIFVNLKLQTEKK